MLDSPASLSLAYNELSIDSKKRDEKMKNLDPKKKEQMERLGMGAGSVRWGLLLLSQTFGLLGVLAL